uniref:Uncharacterized protein n=1 Tax=Parascaris univalens TaxID=6257 RepID=A0A915C2Q8_PARUN
MRGCVDRFLLFGLDEDVRDALVDRSECRATDRQLLHLVSLSPDTDLVLVCSCTGTLCNNANMDHVVSSSRQSVIPLTSLLIITTLLTSHSMWNI